MSVVLLNILFNVGERSELGDVSARAVRQSNPQGHAHTHSLISSYRGVVLKVFGFS